MAESKIEWTTDYTFNPWRGCTKVSPACENCYAETLSKRNPDVLGVWGKHGTRAIAAESYWKLPIKWNRQAEAEGVRKRVFCASLADVFEGGDTMPDVARDAVYDARLRLFELIDKTPYLDWLLLTKRPDNVRNVMQDVTLGTYGEAWNFLEHMPNVWIGTTVENQKYANERIPELLKIPAKVRFLSVEPMLGPISLSFAGDICQCGHPTRVHYNSGNEIVCEGTYSGNGHFVGAGACECPFFVAEGNGIDWVICGGESGANARPVHPDWIRSIRDQCQAAGVPFFFKQWGEWKPMGQMTNGESDCYYDPKYGRSRRSEYEGILPKPKPASSMILQLDGSDQGLYFPEGAMTCFKVGKKKAGRLLDGREWSEFPEVVGA